MKKVVLSLIAAVILTTVLPFSASGASKAYVTNTLEAALRTGPSSENRVVTMLPAGTPAEILSTRHDWTRVRVSEGTGKVREGWVQSRFLGTDSPEQMQAKGLEMENASVKERLAELEKEKQDFARKEKDLLDKIAKLEASYKELESGSANYIKLKEECESTKSALADAQGHNNSLIQENENLRLSQRIKWFGMGALVLFFGWFVGIVTGKRRRRRSPYHL